uniref:Regulatory protein zeste n=1 Tax=Bactrocera dorsalis TaxID=27457 RepID=A0A034WE19_BACDO
MERIKYRINKVSTNQQLDRLVDLVTENPNVGRNRRLYGASREELKKIWEQFAVELNRLGPPSRTGPEWQRVWIHYKASLKRKLARNRQIQETNEPGVFREISFSATEEKAYEITKKLDLFSPNTTEFVDVSTNGNETPPPTAESPLITENAEPPSKRSKTAEAQMHLLEGMAGKQDEMLRTLRQLRSTQHRMYQLKLEKYKLLKKREKEASALRNLRIQLAKEKLKQIKK